MSRTKNPRQLRSAGTNHPTASTGDPDIYTAANSSDEETDQDEDGIPSSLKRPSSSRGDEPLSLGRRQSKPRQLSGVQTARPMSRRSMPAVQQGPDSSERQPQKRRKTMQDPYATSGSPTRPRPQKGPANHVLTLQDRDDIVPSTLQHSDHEIEDGAEEEAAPPGLLNKVQAACARARDVAPGTGNSNKARSPRSAERSDNSASEGVIESVVAAGNGADATTIRSDQSEADNVSVKEEEDSEETLFVQQGDLELPTEEDSDSHVHDRPVQQEGQEAEAESSGDVPEDEDEADLEPDNAVTGVDSKHELGAGSEGDNQDEEQTRPGTPPAKSPTSNRASSPYLAGVDSEDEIPAAPTGKAGAAELFQQDVASFTRRHGDQVEFPITFKAIPEDALDTVHMRYEEFRKCILLMKDDPWTGHGRIFWVTRPLSTLEPSTTPGRALFNLVAKIERLCSEAPRAPRTKSQSEFLHQHEAIVSHYLSQMQLICRHIPQQRLQRHQHGTSQQSKRAVRKRDEMLNEMMTHLIPMLLHCANCIWMMTGKEDHNVFTKCTIDLFEHIVKSVRQLCETVVKVLVRPTAQASKTSAHKAAKADMQREQAQSLAYQLLLAIKEIGDARDALADEGEKRKRRQEKQAVLMEKMKKNHEAVKLQFSQLEAQRVARDAQQAAQTRTAKSKPAVGIRRQIRQHSESLEAKPVSKTQAKHRDMPLRSVPKQLNRQFRKWSREEQAFLLGKIQTAYTAVPGEPRLPDIDGYICIELNRPVKDILHQTETLLALMLQKTGEIEDDEERKTWVRQLMSTYPSGKTA